MRVTCGNDFPRQMFGVWVWRETPQGPEIFRPGIGWVGYPAGTEQSPSYEFPDLIGAEVVQAVAAWAREHSTDPGTEAKILRESLALERKRVDKMLAVLCSA